jgi:hypothetical protein
MVSLLLGLGGELFASLPAQAAIWLKISLLSGALLWSLSPGCRILRGQGPLSGTRPIALI